MDTQGARKSLPLLLRQFLDGKMGTAANPDRSHSGYDNFWRVYFGRRSVSEFKGTVTYPYAMAGKEAARLDRDPSSRTAVESMFKTIYGVDLYLNKAGGAWSVFSDDEAVSEALSTLHDRTVYVESIKHLTLGQWMNAIEGVLKPAFDAGLLEMKK